MAGGGEVWSMCAIDALGIPAMLGQDVVITSADPVTGEPVTVTAGPDRGTVWEPPGAVVFVGRRSWLARPGRHGQLRRPQLLHQHRPRPYLGARTPGWTRHRRRPGPR